MERTGLLLESGVYCGHYYGTPLPLSNPINPMIGNYSNETIEDKMSSNNGKSTETNLTISNSINNKELLSPLDQLSCSKTIANQQLNNDQNSLQEPVQLSAMALKRRRNRSNIAAIDANALPRGWECIKDDQIHGVYYIDHINKVS